MTLRKNEKEYSQADCLRFTQDDKLDTFLFVAAHTKIGEEDIVPNWPKEFMTGKSRSSTENWDPFLRTSLGEKRQAFSRPLSRAQVDVKRQIFKC